MLQKLRWSIIHIFCAFVLFGVAWLGFTRISDPLPPWQALVRLHPEIGVTYQVMVLVGELAFFMMLAAGVPVVLSAIKHALVAKQSDLLLLLGGATFIFFVFIVFAVLVTVMKVNGASVLGVLAGIFAILALLAVTTLLVLAVARSRVSERILRLALTPASLLVLAMCITLAAMLIEILQLLNVAPDMLASNGTVNWIIVGLLMLGSTIWAALALLQGLRLRFSLNGA